MNNYLPTNYITRRNSYIYRNTQPTKIENMDRPIMSKNID